MAVLFTTLLTSLGSAASAVGATAAAATTAVGGGLSFASIAATVVGGLASIMAGSAQKAAMDQQAVDKETEAVQSTLEGRQSALDAMRRMNADIAGISVAGYASGIGSSGTIAAAQDDAQKIGEQNMSLARSNAVMQSQARRGQAWQLRAEGRAAMVGGIMGAVEGGLSLMDRRGRRG